MAVKRICLFTGNANPELAQEISRVLGSPMGEARVSRFSDGETFCEIRENGSWHDTSVIPPTSPHGNHTLPEMPLSCEAP